MKFVIQGGDMLDTIVEKFRKDLAREFEDSEHTTLDDSIDEDRYINFDYIIVEVLK